MHRQSSVVPDPSGPTTKIDGALTVLSSRSSIVAFHDPRENYNRVASTTFPFPMRGRVR